MKAKIKLDSYNYTDYNDWHWENKYMDRIYIPFEFFRIYEKQLIINVIPALVKTFGDFKFISPIEKKIYWIKKELIYPIVELENELFDI